MSERRKCYVNKNKSFLLIYLTSWFLNFESDIKMLTKGTLPKIHEFSNNTFIDFSVWRYKKHNKEISDCINTNCPENKDII